MQAGVTADVLATIQRQYKFKRYLVNFAHDEELAAEVLARGRSGRRLTRSREGKRWCSEKL